MAEAAHVLECRTRGDEKCRMALAGFASGRTHGQLWRCPTCGRIVDSRGGVVYSGDGEERHA